MGKIKYQDMFQVYMHELENDIIKEIAKKKKVSINKAMDIYYKSRFSDLIAENKENIAFLDYRNLTEIILNK